MKIKSIDNFTLEECNEYLNSNPNGEYVQKVLERMKYLSQSKERESHNAHEDFLKQFNRHYVTGEYNDAFLLCLNSINTPSLSSLAYDKGKMVIPFLSRANRIPIPSRINMDIIIDILIENGYKKISRRKDEQLLLPDFIVRLDKKNFITVDVNGPIAGLAFIVGILFLIFPISILLGIRITKHRRKKTEQICIYLLEYMKTH